MESRPNGLYLYKNRYIGARVLNRNLQSHWSEPCLSRQQLIQRFFEHRLPSLCRTLATLPSEISIEFDITGPEPSRWVLEVSEVIRVRRGTHAWPDCRIQLSSVVFEELVDGHYTGREAFLSGALVVQGDVGLGLLLEAAWHQKSIPESAV